MVNGNNKIVSAAQAAQWERVIIPLVLLIAVGGACWWMFFDNNRKSSSIEQKAQFFIKPAERRIQRYIYVLSSTVFMVIIAAVIWRDESMLHELISPHIFISFFLVFSGILFNYSNVSRLCFHFACSVSWYGVFYLFVTSESGTRFYTKILRPSWMLAFMSFCMALLVRSELRDPWMYLHPATSSIGIMGLLFYYWGVELNLDHHQILQHDRGVMRALPSKLEDLRDLHSNHRVTYSILLVAIHYLCALVMHLMHKGPKEDRIKAKMDRAHARLKKLGRPTDGTHIIAEEDLPDDCIEVSLDEAFRLTGATSSLNRDDDASSRYQSKSYGV